MGWLLKNWQLIAIVILLAGVAFAGNRWQKAEQEVGRVEQKLVTQEAYSRGLKNQLDEANTLLKSSETAAAVSYGHCQDLITSDAAKNFDLGVTFGRSTCPTLPSAQ